MVFLNSYGIGTARAVRIYKTYGDRAIELVKSNPYRLTTDIWGVGFKTADELATRLGLPKDSPLRAPAAGQRLHCLQELSGKGHVGFPEYGVIEESNSADQHTNGSCSRRSRRIGPPGRRAGPRQGPFAERRHGRLALFEAAVSWPRTAWPERFGALAQGDHPLADLDVEAVIAWSERKMWPGTGRPRNGKRSRPPPRIKCSSSPAAPGRRQNHHCSRIGSRCLRRVDCVALAAPTGRAAKRLAESTGREGAQTIHRLLSNSIPSIGRFKPQQR